MTGWTGVLPREVRALEEVSGNWAEWARYGQMTWKGLHGSNPPGPAFWGQCTITPSFVHNRLVAGHPSLQSDVKESCCLVMREARVQ